MKFRVDLKDPDGFYDAVEEVVKDSIPRGLSKEENKVILADRVEEVFEKIERWVKYSEYITIEFDTEAGTATVVPNN